MYSVAKFDQRTGRLGRPLSTPYTIFDQENVRFRYGATSMIAGKPGSFKSVLALNMLVRWVQEGYTGVYFSADSDEFTVARRLAGIVTNADAHKVDADFLEGNLDAYRPALNLMRDVRFEYRALDMDGIADRLKDFEDVRGNYADIVFIDNLIDFSESSDDWAAMRDMTRELDALARETRSHICVLHHASDATSFVWDPAIGKSRPRNTYDPVPRSAIQGKITQIPRLVLTVAANERALAVSCVKNTNGPQYPDATHFMRFQVAESLRVTDNYRDVI